MKRILEELDAHGLLAGRRGLFRLGPAAALLLGLASAAIALVLLMPDVQPVEGGEGEVPMKGDEDAAESEVPTAKGSNDHEGARPPTARRTGTRRDEAIASYVGRTDGPLYDLFLALDRVISGLGADVERVGRARYMAYKRGGSNFACVVARRSSSEVLLYLKLDPLPSVAWPAFARDVRGVGHPGTGDLELRLREPSQLELAREYLRRSYEAAGR